MTNQPHSRHDQQQQRDTLANELADLLLGGESPVRGNEAFTESLDDYDRLVKRQVTLRELDASLVNVIPGIEQAESQVLESQKTLAAVKKARAGFAGQLGKAAFAGQQAGELEDHPRFKERKELQSQIDAINQQKSQLSAGEDAGMVAKAKLRAQQLVISGKITIEELKIGPADKGIGESLLNAEEELSVRCGQTEEVLEDIFDQQKRVAVAREALAQAESRLAEQKSSATERLRRTTCQDAASLKSELKELRKEFRLNEKAIASLRDSVVTATLETESLRNDAIVGDKLKLLWSLNFDLNASRPQSMKLVDQSVTRFKALPAKVKYGACGVAGVLLLLLLISVSGGGNDESDTGDGSSDSTSGDATVGVKEEPSPEVKSPANESPKSPKKQRVPKTKPRVSAGSPKPYSAPASRIVRTVTSPTSTKYRDRGFKSFRFGDPPNKVTTALASHPVRKGQPNHQFVFDGDKLVGYGRRYRGDNKQYVSLVRDLLGGAEKKCITQVSTRSDGGADGRDLLRGVNPRAARRIVDSHQSILARFYCPQTIASSYVTWSSDSRSSLVTEYLTLNLWDREWVDTHLEHHVDNCRDVLSWIISNVVAKSATLKLKSEVRYPATEGLYKSTEWIEFITLKKLDVARAATSLRMSEDHYRAVMRGEKKLDARRRVKGKDAKDKTRQNDWKQLENRRVAYAKHGWVLLDDGPRESIRKSFLTITRRIKKSRSVPFEGVVYCDIYLDNTPGFTDSLYDKAGWIITIEKDRCTSLVAQQLFPPRGKTITVSRKNDSHMSSYSWRTRDGWNVVVGPGNRVRANNEPEETL